MNTEIKQLILEIIPVRFFYYVKISIIFLFIIFWIFSISYVAKDASKRVKDTFIRILLIILTVIAGPVGLIIHLILRPSETLSEAIQTRLEKTILTKEFENNLCPFCSSVIEKDYIICPSCGKQLARHCIGCNRVIKKSFKICPYCGNAD